MPNTIAHNQSRPVFAENGIRLLLTLAGVFLSIVGLAIFQDFLKSQREGHAFYFDESLLFKAVWFLFVPILAVLYHRLQMETLDSRLRTVMSMVLPIAAHLLILPFVAVVFSWLFYGGRYDLYKFFSYTLAHDLYKLET